MAERPWVTPDEVREYTNNEVVKARTDAQLELDIARAEEYVMTYTRNDFKAYEPIPASVKTAVILLAEAYGWNTYVATKELQSESFDDYSYTSGSSEIDIDDLDIAALLDRFVLARPSGRTVLKFRRL